MPEKRHETDPHDRHEVELDLTRGMHAGTVRQAAGIIVAGFIVLALFNAQGFKKWAQTLPDNPVANRVIDAAYIWDGWMAKLGTNGAFLHLRRAFRDFRDSGRY